MQTIDQMYAVTLNKHKIAMELIRDLWYKSHLFVWQSIIAARYNPNIPINVYVILTKFILTNKIAHSQCQ